MEENVKAMSREIIMLALSDVSYNIKEGEKHLKDVETKIDTILSTRKKPKFRLKISKENIKINEEIAEYNKGVKEFNKINDKELAYLRHEKDETIEKIKNYYDALAWFNSPSREQRSYYYWLGFSSMNGQAIKEYIRKIQKES